jgi:arylsulfatase A-like enzyme
MLTCAAFGSAYNARPKLVVVIVIDQFRGDYLERFRDQFGDGGFRLFLDHGAYFTNCYYNYANTRTAPGHATLFTGTYINGHGIISNEWWDPQKKREITSVQDDATRIVGVPDSGPGASPHNLLADTIGDELKLATGGKARVFSISLKDRGAILPAGFAADGAYWIDKNTGNWVTSTYYRNDLPDWAKNFNDGKRSEKYLNREWKDSKGNVLGTTSPQRKKDGTPVPFYDVVSSTPFGNDYELEFARELVLYEHLGSGPSTDLLSISLSSNDSVGHDYGPNSPQVQAMTLATDHQLAEFFNFLGHEVGLANVWIALSADHGVAALPSEAMKLRVPAANLDGKKMRAQLNAAMASRFGKAADYVSIFAYPLAFLDESAFASAKVREDDAERAVGDAMDHLGLRGYFTKVQLAQGSVPDTAWGRKFLNTYSPEPSWFVVGIPAPFTVGSTSGTDHASPYSYDTHVPLALYGLPFQTGTYRSHAEPIDLAVTLASLLGINAPTHATGRVLTEALAAPKETRTPSSKAPHAEHDAVQPTAWVRPGSTP